MGTNHKPSIRGRDEGIWRRMHMIPFTVTIPDHKKDKKMLKHKLKKEAPGILNWAVQGCLLWQREGLGMPAKGHGCSEGIQIRDGCCISVSKPMHYSVRAGESKHSMMLMRNGRLTTMNTR